VIAGSVRLARPTASSPSLSFLAKLILIC